MNWQSVFVGGKGITCSYFLISQLPVFSIFPTSMYDLYNQTRSKMPSDIYFKCPVSQLKTVRFLFISFSLSILFIKLPVQTII